MKHRGRIFKIGNSRTYAFVRDDDGSTAYISARHVWNLEVGDVIEYDTEAAEKGPRVTALRVLA